MLDWFADESNKLDWNRKRKLPDWAERIFSTSMVAAGNVSEPTELEQIFAMAKKGIDHYLETVDETNRTVSDTTDAQNFYCINQKQNPHTPRVMVSLGLSEDDVTHFIQDCLFPEIRQIIALCVYLTLLNHFMNLPHRLLELIPLN